MDIYVFLCLGNNGPLCGYFPSITWPHAARFYNPLPDFCKFSIFFIAFNLFAFTSCRTLSIPESPN
jgi:hypothetical protein